MRLVLYAIIILLLLISPLQTRKYKNGNVEQIEKIRDEAKNCQTLECMGSKCMQLYPFANVEFVTKIEDFAKMFQQDLIDRGWYQGQDVIKDIKDNDYRGLTKKNGDIVIFQKQKTEKGKIPFDLLHELCHLLSGKEGLSYNFKFQSGLKFLEAFINLMAKKYALKNRNLVDTKTLDNTYPLRTKRLEKIFETFENERLAPDILFGTKSFSIPYPEYNKCAKTTLNLITLNDSNNFFVKKEPNCEEVTYNRGILLLGNDIYKKINFVSKILGIKKQFISYYTITRKLYDPDAPFFNILNNFKKELKSTLEQKKEKIINKGL